MTTYARVGSTGLKLNLNLGTDLTEAMSIPTTIYDPDGVVFGTYSAVVSATPTDMTAVVTITGTIVDTGRYVVSPVVTFSDGATIPGDAAAFYVYDIDEVVT